MDSCFDKIRGGNYTLYIHRNFRNDTFEQTLLADERQLHKRYHPAPVPSSKFTKVYKFSVGFSDVEKVIYFKEYFCRSAWDFIKHLFRSSRAKRSLKATLMLQKNGFDVPIVVAMGECKAGFFKRGNFLATLEAENTKRLHKYIPDSEDNLTGEPLQEKRRLIRAFGQTIGRMHAKGIFHGDLRLGNILARQEKNRWRFFFLDNERTRKFYRLPARLRLKNLVQVNMFPPAAMSSTDRMRFFREYWAQNEKAKTKKAELIEKVLKKTHQRLSKKEKFG